MLLDEPTSALDPARTTQIAALVRRLKKDNVATIIVSHDQQFAYQVTDRMVSLDSGHLVDLHQEAACCAALMAPLAHASRVARSAFGAPAAA